MVDMTKNHWTDNFISYDGETDEYVGYDCEFTELIRDYVRVNVVKYLVKYGQNDEGF
jgi:hypothetical protein